MPLRPCGREELTQLWISSLASSAVDLVWRALGRKSYFFGISSVGDSEKILYYSLNALLPETRVFTAYSTEGRHK